MWLASSPGTNRAEGGLPAALGAHPVPRVTLPGAGAQRAGAMGRGCKLLVPALALLALLPSAPGSRSDGGKRALTNTWWFPSASAWV